MRIMGMEYLLQHGRQAMWRLSTMDCYARVLMNKGICCGRPTTYLSMKFVG